MITFIKESINLIIYQTNDIQIKRLISSKIGDCLNTNDLNLNILNLILTFIIFLKRKFGHFKKTH